MKIQLPFHNEGKYPITQVFGAIYQYRGVPTKHFGVDWAMPKGTQIVAPFTGIVSRVTPLQVSGYGKSIQIIATDESKGKIECLCAHLDVIGVQLGWRVVQGNAIGISGNSGFWIGYNGYHLHFGIRKDGYWVDPLQFYKKEPFENQVGNLFNQNPAPEDPNFLPPHTVVAGDTLWNISLKNYGRGALFNQIFLANQNILKNPWKIYPGQVLQIPRLVTKKV